MKICQHLYTSAQGWTTPHAPSDFDAQAVTWVIGFGSTDVVASPEIYAWLRASYPQAQIVLGSTEGEILGERIHDNAVVVTAVSLEKTELRAVQVRVADHAGSYAAGAALVQQLDAPDLQFVFILSDGQAVNGSELVQGMESVLQHRVPVTGGLAGDGPRFQRTLVGLNAAPQEGILVGMGFYGSSLQVAHGSKGGWDMFGPDRLVTRAEGNILYELDGRNALELYKQYLGEFAAQLPGAALLFPLSVRLDDQSEPVVRTILNVDEETQGMIFAGDIPNGSRARFMKANFDKVVDGAFQAAFATARSLRELDAELVFLISCVGRRLVLGPRTEEEVEVCRHVFGKQVPVTGFYSYGEISPYQPNARCELHNQTMTITALREC